MTSKVGELWYLGEHLWFPVMAPGKGLNWLEIIGKVLVHVTLKLVAMEINYLKITTCSLIHFRKNFQNVEVLPLMVRFIEIIKYYVGTKNNGLVVRVRFSSLFLFLYVLSSNSLLFLSKLLLYKTAISLPLIANVLRCCCLASLAHWHSKSYSIIPWTRFPWWYGYSSDKSVLLSVIWRLPL